MVRPEETSPLSAETNDGEKLFHAKKFAIPLVSSPWNFALLSHAELKKFISEHDGQLECSEFDRYLGLFPKVHLVVVDLHGKTPGVRIAITDKEDVIKSENLLENCDVLKPVSVSLGGYKSPCILLKWKTNVGGANCDLPASSVCVSQWYPWPYQHVANEAIANMFVSVYGAGHGTRSSTDCVGMNLYQGS